MQGNVVKMNFIAVGKFCLVKGVVKSKCHRLEGGIYDVQSNKKKSQAILVPMSKKMTCEKWQVICIDALLRNKGKKNNI